MKKKVLSIITNSADETCMVASLMGKHSRPGTIITLDGDLGSGKTSFVQGLAVGLDIPSQFYITSPTYNIINEYPGRIPLYHMDLYRLGGPDDLHDTGFYDLINGQGVTAIEWPNKFIEAIGEPDINIQIKILSENSRSVRFEIYGLDKEELIGNLENLSF